MKTQMRVLRKVQGLTQSEVAERIGVTKACYSFWENGDREPSLSNLCRLADLLRVGRTTVTMWETGETTPPTKYLLPLAEILSCTVEELLKPE